MSQVELSGSFSVAVGTAYSDTFTLHGATYFECRDASEGEYGIEITVGGGSPYEVPVPAAAEPYYLPLASGKPITLRLRVASGTGPIDGVCY